MAPQSLSLLFPKKNQKKGYIPPPKPKPRPADGTASPVPKKVEEPEEERFQLPDAQYSEFQVLSSSLKGWKYDVMKFDSRKPVEILKWAPPVKLNRKDTRRDERLAAAALVPQAAGPMLGPDGKPVIGSDGKVVMVDAEGKPIHNTTGDYGPKKGGKRKPKKKTRQVFKIPEETRRLQREERYPWVLEDSNPVKKEHWIGQLEDTTKAETHGFFMPAANEAFKFVPAHRWYKFQKVLKSAQDVSMSLDNVEAAMKAKQDPAKYLASLGASAATQALFKKEDSGLQLPNGSGRRLKTVDRPTTSLFDDDDGFSGKQKAREMDQEGDLDEQEYEEDFADDEEPVALEADDEEAKATEERIKREYKQANKLRETGVDESEDEDNLPKDKKALKKMQKMIRSRENNNAYEESDEENPYASEEEESSDEEPVYTGPAIQPQPGTVDPKAANANRPPGVGPGTHSRATSPTASPSLGGHSLIAKRATSPNMPKPKIPGINSLPGSRATSPNPPGSRATSPLAGAPSPTNSKAGKRKADDGNVEPKPKKKKIHVTTAEMEAMLIDWLRKTPQPTTRDCIQHFNSYLVDGEKKKEFSDLVKRLALLKNGTLSLRPGFES